MASLRLIIAALSFVSLAAIASPRNMGPNDVKQTESPQELAPMSKNLQAATRARCALLAGPEYHECLYAVMMNRPARGRTRETQRSG